MFARLRAKYRYSWILLRELVRTDFKLRYQGSVLGVAWSLLKPLFIFLVLYFVFVKFLKVGSDVPHWPVGLLFGIMLWSFFTEITNNGVGAVVGKGDLIRKINFPKYIIIFASSISAVINLGFSMIVIAIFMIANGVELLPTAPLALLPIVELFIFGVGVSFSLATINVKIRDINMIWEIITQALFYGSAVIYPLSMIFNMNGAIGKFFLLNPIVQCLQDARYLLISPTNLSNIGLRYNILYTLIPIGLVIATFIFGAWIFRRNSPKFAEEV